MSRVKYSLVCFTDGDHSNGEYDIMRDDNILRDYEVVESGLTLSEAKDRFIEFTKSAYKGMINHRRRVLNYRKTDFKEKKDDKQ